MLSSTDYMVLAAIAVAILVGFFLLGNWIWLLLGFSILGLYVFLTQSRKTLSVNLVADADAAEHAAEHKEDENKEQDDVLKEVATGLPKQDPPKKIQKQIKMDELARRMFPSVGLLKAKANSINAFTKVQLQSGRGRRKGSANDVWV